MQITLDRIRGKVQRSQYLLRQLASPLKLVRYIGDYRRFEREGGMVAKAYPVLKDYDAQAGTTSTQYFHQDLLVATLIHERRPVRHIDIGSRIDGFVAHVAAFRKIEVMDVRALEDTGHPNISFVKADLMDTASATHEIADSVSCLHAIEHFGLGRYGDPIDPAGHVKGFRNILSMLKPGGILYISFPIGRATAVHFNAHRVFDPTEIMRWLPDGFHVESFDYVDDAGKLIRDIRSTMDKVSVNDGCGIYSVRRSAVGG